MSTPTHLLGSYLILTVTKPIWKDKYLKPKTASRLLIYGLILSIAIDLDVLWSSQGIANHHLEFPHWPLFWLTIVIVIFIVGYFKKSPLLKSLAIITLIATSLHFFLDSFGVTLGIPYLAPFSMRQYSLTILHEPFNNNQERVIYVLTHPEIIYRELLVLTLAFGKIYLDLSNKYQHHPARLNAGQPARHT